MKARKYNSFKEIDKHLKVLKLKSKIDIESIKLNTHNIKAQVYPKAILNGIGGYFQMAILSFLTQKVLKKIRLLNSLQ